MSISAHCLGLQVRTEHVLLQIVQDLGHLRSPRMVPIGDGSGPLDDDLPLVLVY